MEAVDAALADQAAEHRNEGLRHTGVDNGADDLGVIILLVLLRVRMQQLVDDIGELAGDFFTHLRARIFGGHRPADLNQPVDGNAAPVLKAGPVLLRLQRLLRLVNQRGKQRAVRLADGVLKQGFNFIPHHAGGAVEQIAEGLALPMQVAEKILRPLRQAADRVQVDDFGGCRRNGGIILCKQLQIMPVRHSKPPVIEIAPRACPPRGIPFKNRPACGPII